MPGEDAMLSVTQADAPVWIPTPLRAMDDVTLPAVRAVPRGQRFVL